MQIAAPAHYENKGGTTTEFVDDSKAKPARTTTFQIRQPQIGAPPTHESEADSVFEEHEAVFLLSTAFKTFPSSPKTGKINTSERASFEKRTEEG